MPFERFHEASKKLGSMALAAAMMLSLLGVLLFGKVKFDANLGVGRDFVNLGTVGPKFSLTRFESHNIR